MTIRLQEILAAPELVQALRYFISCCELLDDHRSTCSPCAKARAVLAKVEKGESDAEFTVPVTLIIHKAKPQKSADQRIAEALAEHDRDHPGCTQSPSEFSACKMAAKLRGKD